MNAIQINESKWCILCTQSSLIFIIVCDFTDVLESTRIEEKDPIEDLSDDSISDLERTQHPPHLTLFEKQPTTVSHLNAGESRPSSPMLQVYKGQLRIRIFNNYGQITTHGLWNSCPHFSDRYQIAFNVYT